MNVIRSVSDNQAEIIEAIRALHCPDGFDCDLTFGSGTFWRGTDAPKYRYDIDPQQPGVTQSCSTTIPHEDSSLQSVVFDPPFLTYVRTGRSGNGPMIMSRRFGGYWTYGELEEHYTATIRDCGRVIVPGGVLTIKCQDIVHNHTLHSTHANVIRWAADHGFRLLDTFILIANHRLPAPNRNGTQKHSRIFHSYFLVFKRLTHKQHLQQLWRLNDGRTLEAAQ